MSWLSFNDRVQRTSGTLSATVDPSDMRGLATARPGNVGEPPRSRIGSWAEAVSRSVVEDSPSRGRGDPLQSIVEPPSSCHMSQGDELRGWRDRAIDLPHKRHQFPGDRRHDLLFHLAASDQALKPTAETELRPPRDRFHLIALSLLPTSQRITAARRM